MCISHRSTLISHPQLTTHNAQLPTYCSFPRHQPDDKEGVEARLLANPTTFPGTTYLLAARPFHKSLTNFPPAIAPPSHTLPSRTAPQPHFTAYPSLAFPSLPTDYYWSPQAEEGGRRGQGGQGHRQGNVSRTGHSLFTASELLFGGSGSVWCCRRCCYHISWLDPSPLSPYLSLPLSSSPLPCLALPCSALVLLQFCSVLFGFVQFAAAPLPPLPS
ncbi:hypothetical protein BKA65DRAFT_84339 [Rhexocercosporidium sp. MPI-PUGE-AT-0058]|nr:hypothetical protein BKA65DRAFT_84339 [Rhexocercosporidium sp. MPI-PUGE-AT-0058]